jgi:hypothetical protein
MRRTKRSPYPSREYYEEWRKNRYRIFNEKIDALKDHPKYKWLREQADKAIRMNESWGWDMIAGETFIEQIENSPVERIREWLDN